MNEEETISILEDMLEKAGKLYEEEFYTLVEDKHMWAIRGLLNLYNQEKEKNKKLEEENKYLQDYLDGMEGGLHEQIREQQKQISELYEELEGNC